MKRTYFPNKWVGAKKNQVLPGRFMNVFERFWENAVAFGGEDAILKESQRGRGGHNAGTRAAGKNYRDAAGKRGREEHGAGGIVSDIQPDHPKGSGYAGG